MESQTPRPSPAEIMEELRRLRNTSVDAMDRLSILHDVAVYQEELVAQNEALMHAQTMLEQARDRYIELYDFAPNAYLTLDTNGIIRQSNLTAAALLGRSKPALEGMPLLGFVASGHRGAYLDFLRRCRNSDSADIETEIAIRSGEEGRHIQVEMICRVRTGHDGSREFFTALVDVTDRKQLELERDRNVRELGALAGSLISAQEDERRRIARDLHDDVGQQITALRLRLDDLASTVSNATNGDALVRIQEMLQHLDKRLHFVARELRPAALDVGIVAALDQFVREWSATVGVPAAFHSGGVEAGILSTHVETNLYRIAQEALNNAAKHAAASRVTVVLEHRDDTVILVVEDNGRGFDLAATRKDGKALGLVGIRERAQIVGGRLEVETFPGNGTSIYVQVPHKRVPRG